MTIMIPSINAAFLWFAVFAAASFACVMAATKTQRAGHSRYDRSTPLSVWFTTMCIVFTVLAVGSLVIAVLPPDFFVRAKP